MILSRPGKRRNDLSAVQENNDVSAVESGDFSLVLGGPLFQLLRRAHLSGQVLELLVRRVIFMTLLAWLPLLVLSVVEGHAWGSSVKMPFLFDVDVHARLLLSLPLFIVAELVVHQRMRVVVGQFVGHGLITAAQRPKFDAALASAMRLRNSVVVEVLLIALVYGVGVLLIWRTHAAIGVTSWYGPTVDGQLHPSLAGWWYGCLSLPLIQFILLRWYFRMFLWARFLWQVSRIELQIMPTHPDRVGGLGFLSNVAYAFTPLLTGQGVMLAGVIANKIFFAGAKLPDFKMDLIALVTVMVSIVLGPVLVFAPRLASAKRNALREYGGLAQRYVREFDHKWLRGGAVGNEAFLGNADIQSLADMGNSFEVIREMRCFPVTRDTIIRLALATLLPVLPLLLTMFSMEELINRVLKVVF